MAELIQAWPIVEGSARGEALVSREPLSFWGGYDQETGEIIDRRHPLNRPECCGTHFGAASQPRLQHNNRRAA